ncbi:MAG TPA: alpha/beta hydrolase, partial [Acidimicrobiales bacterium]|nr:alpha/beta hydrolase [Acidimicrobiales bacterium]
SGLQSGKDGRDGADGHGARRVAALARRGAAAGVVLALGVLGTAGWGGTSQAATSGTSLRGRLLSVDDLPAGWSASRLTSAVGDQLTTSACGAALVALLSPPGLSKDTLGPTYETARFVEGAGVPSLTEALASGPQAEQAWQRLDTVLAGCTGATLARGAAKVVATRSPVRFPRVGRNSSTSSWTLTVSSGGGVTSDLVLFAAGTDYGYLSYTDLESPPVPTVTAFARAAVAKATNGSTAPVPDSVSIASVPVRTVRTTLGTVAYREIGAGPALVMITGWSAIMEDWDPFLVDELAQHHRVVIFDNAGIGRTTALPAPLTVDAMADQTGALIDALHLGRPAVLGWSMGTAIAQAVAVLHPQEVGALVLCAPYPGDGAVVLPPASVLDAKSDPTALFPANQSVADGVYEAEISSYPKASLASAATDSAQLSALHQWWAGGDRAGHLVAEISAPTLIADGSADRLDPVANSRLLARLIPGARLKLYPDAGHGFLFQDDRAFAALVDSFLGQAK